VLLGEYVTQFLGPQLTPTSISGVAFFFFLQWVLLMTQMFWVCEKIDTAWKNHEFVQCVLGEAVGITQVASTSSLAQPSFSHVNNPAAETISDFILVIAPLWILNGVRVSPGLRIRLIAIFSCSLMTTVVGVIHVVLILKMPGALEAIMGKQLLPARHFSVTSFWETLSAWLRQPRKRKILRSLTSLPTVPVIPSAPFSKF
jgi:hypothetical protein